MSASGTLETIALALARLFAPLEERLGSGQVRLLFAELGLQFPPALETIPSFTNATESAVSHLKQLPNLVVALVEAIASENVDQILTESTALISVIRSVIQDIDAIATALRNAGAATGLPASDVTEFANALPERLIEYLVARNLESIPGTAEGLEFIGALERREENVGSADPAKPTYTRRTLHLDQLVSFLESPGDRLETQYGWGTPSFDGMVLLQTLQRLLTTAGVPAILDTSVSPPTLDVVFLEISPKTDISPKGLMIRAAEAVQIDNAAPFIQDDWQLEFVLNNELAVGTQIILQPNDTVTFIPPSGQLQGEAYLQWVGGTPGGSPYLILGQADGSRLDAQQLIARAGVGFAWNSTTNQAQGVFVISGEIKRGKIVISLNEADGFLGQLLAGLGLESDFDVGFGFSTRDGLFFHGSSTLEIQLPVHLTLGPIDISALTIGVGLQTPLPIDLSVNVKAALGPLQALVEQIGFSVTLAFPSDQDGNLGPVDLGFGFKPPEGAGLSLDVSVVKGGGYLFFDNDRGEYAGALELVFSGFLTLKAIGLITTRLPDGSKGFSLLIIITAEFGTGFQLGFGFVLLGVGGLLGLNRTMKLEPLTEGVRTGAIESVMFPKDVVENAPRIISDLRQFFPPEEGIFLIGPLAKLGWGTPALITLSLGIIIEIPGNIAILGILKVVLPDERAALLVLQVNFIGAIEFDKQRVYFFATLFESRILFNTIEGGMGVLMAWGNDSNFVVSVGGFHPQFTPPPLPFPTPQRIAVTIVNQPLSRIRVMGYFAVTSNTVQFGARAEIFFGFSKFKLEGHLSFDALFQFSPFFFIIEISCGVSLKVFGIGLFSISLKFSLEGPSPWRAKGYGKLKLLFFSIKANFDFTWGEKKDTSLPPIKVLPLLKGELEKLSNWKAQLPASSNLLVSLRKLEEETEALVLHPVGTLTVTQRAVPLDLRLDKVGNQKPSDGKRFYLDVASGLTKVGDREEPFAIAQFQDFKDAEKLSQAPFQPEDAGLELAVSDQSFATGKAVKRNIRYETHIIDTNFQFVFIALLSFVNRLFTHFLNGNVVTKSVVSKHYKRQFQPFAEKIVVGPEQFVVASTVDNQAISQQAVFTSEAKAHEFMQSEIARDATRRELLHVIPSDEVNV